MTISSEAILPGVWQKKEGGHVVRGHATDPRTGQMREVRRVLKEPNPRKALAWLTLECERIRRGKTVEATQTPTWKSYASSVFTAKVDDGTIKSAKGREKWAVCLGHLYEAPWASFFLDKIKHADLVDWRNTLPALRWERRNKKGELIKTGPYMANTLNDWLNVGRVIFAAATIKYDLPRDPMLGIEDFEVTNRTYTREEPNALTPAEVGKWLATFKEMFPQFYAMVFVGLVHGQRPSTLRPLRRQGETPDVTFGKEPRLQLRRSHTMRDEVWDRTKTERDLDLPLHPAVVKVIKWHIKTQLTTDAQKKSELLFPNEAGGFRSKSCLDKPFAAVTRACKIKKRITPRALRRTFQDLSREAKVDGVVAKAITGHATDAMRVKYSTAQDAEVSAAVGQMVRNFSQPISQPSSHRRARPVTGQAAKSMKS